MTAAWSRGGQEGLIEGKSSYRSRRGLSGAVCFGGLGDSGRRRNRRWVFFQCPINPEKMLRQKGGEGDGYCALFYISKLKRVGKYHARFKRVMTHYVIAIRQGCRLGWRSGVSFLVLGIVRVYGGLTGKDFRDEVGLC